MQNINKKFDSGHLVFSRWSKINSVRPLDNLKTNFMFKVDWVNGSQGIAFKRVVHSIQFKNFDGGHFVFSGWPTVNSVRPLDNMKTNFKFDVDWGNDSKDIVFRGVVHSIRFKKFDGGHLVFSRWPKVNNVCPLDNMKTKFEVDWGNWFLR